MSIVASAGYTFDTETLQVNFQLTFCSDCKGTGKVTNYVSCPRSWKPVKQYPGHVCPDCGAKNRNSHDLLKNAAGERITKTVECYRCKGAGKYTPDFYTYLDFRPLVPFFNIKAAVRGRASDFNEGCIGMGLVAGVTDYTRHTVESALERFHKKDAETRFQFEQGGNLLTPDGHLAKVFMLYALADGYSMYAGEPTEFTKRLWTK